MRLARSLVLLAALAAQGCAIDDGYGNQYGGLSDYGNQYAWQLTTCRNDMAASNVEPRLWQRWMQCCMWRHGVPLDDSGGCTAPPYYQG